jgi:hypothetical protein
MSLEPRPSPASPRLTIGLVVYNGERYLCPDEVLDEAIPRMSLQVGGQHHLVGTGDLQLDRLIVVVSLPHDDRAGVGDAE